MGLEQICTVIDRIAETLVVPVELRAHSRVLRRLTRKHESKTPPFRRRYSRGIRSTCVHVKSAAQLRLGSGGCKKTLGKMAPPDRRGEADISKRRIAGI